MRVKKFSTPLLKSVLFRVFFLRYINNRNQKFLNFLLQSKSRRKHLQKIFAHTTKEQSYWPNKVIARKVKTVKVGKGV